MPINDRTRKEVVLRLKRADGHLQAVIKMVDNQEYCIDVINQLKAVQSALEKSSQIILKNHLETCVKDAVMTGNTEKAIEELMVVYRRAPICFLDCSLQQDKNNNQTTRNENNCCHPE
jgi:DNA-binding FrmR family transcriptional regulator